MHIDMADPKTLAIEALGIKAKKVHFNLSAKELTNATLAIEEGVISESGALCIKTGKIHWKVSKR